MSTRTEQVSAGLGPGDLFDLEFVRDGRFSPDGRHIAYAVSYVDEGVERFEIRIMEVESGNLQRVPHEGNATSPRWSPDGRWLAFVGDGRLRIAAVPSLEIAEPYSPDGLTVQGAFTWSPDSTRLAVSLQQRDPVQGFRRITIAHYRAEGSGFIENLTQRIFVVDRLSRDLRCMSSEADGVCSQPEWSSCGRRILFLAIDTAVPASSYSPRLLTVSVCDGAVATVLDQRWFIVSARWLPGGEKIAVAGTPDIALTVPNPTLWVVDLSGKVELRTPGLRGKIGGTLHHDMPAWDLTRGNALTVLDQYSAYIGVLVAGGLQIWRVALTDQIDMRQVLIGERSCIMLDASVQAEKLLYAAMTLHAPPELYCAALDGTRETRLTRLNDEALARWPSMRVEHFICTSPDGLEIDAWFMSQAAPRPEPLPTVMYIHGGPFAATGHAFRYDFHLLASHGFGVVFANFRGSAGYGDAFTRAIMGDWGTRGFPDHMATVDTAIARGLADPERLGVWGASHGGFATCWIVGHTGRFKAAVAEASVTNFATLYYLTDSPEVFAHDLGGRPHEIADVYRSRSPLTYAHRCTTPTMLIHGERDLRTPMCEAEQFYRALHDVGCTTELVRIPDCDHFGDSCGPLSARLAQNEALLSWFQRYL